MAASLLWLQNYKDEAQKQRKIIYQLEKERDRYINEASDLTQKVLQHMEDVKVREMQIFDYKKKIAEADTKLKQQQVNKSRTFLVIFFCPSPLSFSIIPIAIYVLL